MKGTALRILVSIVVCVVIVAFALPGCSPMPPTTAEAYREIAELRDRLGIAEKAITSLQNQINSNSDLYSGAITDANNRVSTVDGKVNLTIN